MKRSPYFHKVFEPPRAADEQLKKELESKPEVDEIVEAEKQAVEAEHDPEPEVGLADLIRSLCYTVTIPVRGTNYFGTASRFRNPRVLLRSAQPLFP